MKTAHILSTCQCQMFRPYPYLNKLPVLLCCGESKLRLHSYENQIGIGELLSSLRAESARAVTSRRCPHSGVGEDFLVRQRFINNIPAILLLRGAQHNAGQHLCNAVRQEDCLPRGSPSLAADRHQHRRQERAKEQGQISKREANDATNFQTIIHFKEWRRFTLCVLMYSAAGRRGNPMPDNLSLLWFRVNKKKKTVQCLCLYQMCLVLDHL